MQGDEEWAMNSIERHPKQKELLRPLRFFAGGIATRPSFSPSKHPQKRTTATPPLFPSPIHLSKTLLAQTPHPPHQNPAKKKKKQPSVDRRCLSVPRSTAGVRGSRRNGWRPDAPGWSSGVASSSLAPPRTGEGGARGRRGQGPSVVGS